MKAWIWEKIADPLLRKISSRIDHLNEKKSSIHDGISWAPIADVGRGVKIHEDATLNSSGRNGSVIIGDFSHIYGHLWLFGFGQINIGNHSFIGPGSRVWCTEELKIGSNVLISHLVDIHDSNSHSLHWQSRREEIVARFERGDNSLPPDVQTAPVIIEDDVWIGFKSSILKGVTIGRGAIIAAGSVVTHDVLPFTLVAGNPARVVKELPR